MGQQRNGQRPILVVDDDGDARARVCEVLTKAGYAICEAASGTEALEAVRRRSPRLMVLEVLLPGLNGFEVCHRLRNDYGRALPVLLVSEAKRDDVDRVAGLLIGADEFLPKPFAPDELLACVERLAGRSVPNNGTARLTLREREVLTLLSEGLRQNEIAAQLSISSKTVGHHVEHILKKLGVHSRAQAVGLAYRDRLLEIPR